MLRPERRGLEPTRGMVEALGRHELSDRSHVSENAESVVTHRPESLLQPGTLVTPGGMLVVGQRSHTTTGHVVDVETGVNRRGKLVGDAGGTGQRIGPRGAQGDSGCVSGGNS